MAKVKDNQIIIEDDEGQEHLMEILFTYEHEERKSIPLAYFEEKAYLIDEGYIPRLDYLKIIDNIYGG